MSKTSSPRLVERLVARLSASGQVPEASGVLAQAAQRYADTGAGCALPESGFDEASALLFEAVVEAAFLVANADGDFDSTERRLFEEVVSEASAKRVEGPRLAALLEDLTLQLSDDGLARRLRGVGQAIQLVEHRRETLRVAALVAAVSGGVSEVERSTLESLAQSLGLEPELVEQAVGEALQALGA